MRKRRPKSACGAGLQPPVPPATACPKVSAPVPCISHQEAQPGSGRPRAVCSLFSPQKRPMLRVMGETAGAGDFLEPRCIDIPPQPLLDAHGHPKPLAREEMQQRQVQVLHRGAFIQGPPAPTPPSHGCSQHRATQHSTDPLSNSVAGGECHGDSNGFGDSSGPVPSRFLSFREARGVGSSRMEPL